MLIGTAPTEETSLKSTVALISDLSILSTIERGPFTTTAAVLFSRIV